MIRNQYIIHSSPNILNNEYCIEEFHNLTIEHDFDLKYYSQSIKNRSIAVLGFLLDPLRPELLENDLVKELVIGCDSIDQFFKAVQNFSGRFVVLFAYNDDLVMLSDALGLRQIYFRHVEDSIVISSSPELILKSFKLNPHIKGEVLKLIADSDYRTNESPWIGDRWYDKSFLKVLPNHYLDINNSVVKRTPLFISKLSPEDFLSYADKILTGSISALQHRFKKLMMPLTAGWDSRLVMTSSLHLKDKILYYLFINNPSELNSVDAIIGGKLAEKLDLNYKIIYPQKLKNEFLDKFNYANAFPRILPKTRHIQFHYYNNPTRDIININGSGGEIIRRVYQYFEKEQQADLFTLLKVRVYNDHFQCEIEKWRNETADFADRYNLDILDLFYWEQRIGNWHALYDYEQEIGIEEFTPFNNKNLLLTALQLPKKYREKYNAWIFIELMKKRCPQALEEKFNPILGFQPKRRLVVFLRKKPNLLYFLKKIKKSFSK